MMPMTRRWPKPDYDSMVKFYGLPGKVETVKVVPPFKVYLYDSSDVVSGITVHVKIADSFLRVLDLVKKRYPTDEERYRAGINKFFGSYVVRPMRNGTAPSKHSWGVAIDFDANRNGNTTHWPTAAHMPLGVMECFAKEGWINLGWTIGRDAMHMQCSQ